MLTPAQQSKYGTHVFIIPKKEWTVRFITNYHRLNLQLVRKTYPLPRIGDTTHQLQGFHYVNKLDLNMVYYIIMIFTTCRDMTTIFTEFGISIKNHLLMGMCDSGDISRKSKYTNWQHKGDKIKIDDILF